MSEQHGYRVHEWNGDLQWEAFAVPEPAHGEVLIHVEACGIGLTVLNCLSGDLDDDDSLLPRVPGHELVGTVTQVGAGVRPSLRGQRVTAYFYLTCGACRSCLAGDDARCLDLAGWVGVHRDGGYAPWVVLPAHNVVALPAGIDPVAATVIPDAVATPLHVCHTRARISPADRVVVIGAAGGVGIHMIQMARLLGARVAGIDLGESKLAAIEEQGALALPGDDLGVLDASPWRDGPPTVVIDLVGSMPTLQWSIDVLGTGGRLVVLTTFRGRELALDPRQLVFGEITVLGSRYAGRAELATAAELVGSGRIVPVIGAVVSPDGVPDVHGQLRAGELLGRGAVTWA